MRETIRIQETELRQLLSAEDTAEAALEKYFELDDSKPFSVEFRLKPNVEVVRDEGAVDFGPIGSTVVGLANWYFRRKRRKQYNKTREEHPDRLCLVSEGDSWFQHPLITDTIDHLADHYAILSLGAAGDELRNMFRENEYREALENEDAKALLLSGGGNDLMGGRFGEWLNPFSPGSDPRRFLNDKFFQEVGQMATIYRAIFGSLQQLRPETRVITHGYDYVRPGAGDEGKWLGRPMEDMGIRDPEDRAALIRVVIDEFNGQMKAVTDEFDNADFIDLRDTVGADQWHDEIHPDSPGFQQVALRFLDHINATVR